MLPLRVTCDLIYSFYGTFDLVISVSVINYALYTSTLSEVMTSRQLYLTNTKQTNSTVCYQKCIMILCNNEYLLIAIINNYLNVIIILFYPIIYVSARFGGVRRDLTFFQDSSCRDQPRQVFG